MKGNNILVTGADGVIGWPVCMRLALKYPDKTIIGIDNNERRRWVDECGSVSAIPIVSMEERCLAFEEVTGQSNILLIGDSIRKSLLKLLLSLRGIGTVVHLAAQPSAPYSMKYPLYTLRNNNDATLALIMAIKEVNPKIRLIETTTMGIYGTPPIEIEEDFYVIPEPEAFEFLPGHEHRNPTYAQRHKLPLTPFQGGSWYHRSKSYDASMLQFASFRYGIPTVDLRLGVVIGVGTAETKKDSRLATRFDFDFNFGVLANRFVAQALTGYPLTVYGEGGQTRGYISLEDTVQRIVNAVELSNNGYLPINILDKCYSVREMAQHVAKSHYGTEVQTVPNPRKELEDHYYHPSTSRMRKLLGEPKDSLDDVLKDAFTTLEPYKERIASHKEAFMK